MVPQVQGTAGLPASWPISCRSASPRCRRTCSERLRRPSLQWDSTPLGLHRRVLRDLGACRTAPCVVFEGQQGSRSSIRRNLSDIGEERLTFPAHSVTPPTHLSVGWSTSLQRDREAGS